MPLSADGYFIDAARTNGQAKQAHDDNRDFISMLLGASARTELIIEAGVVTIPAKDGGNHTIDTEADAATDDLTHIDQTNTHDGQFVKISFEDAGRVVTVKDAAGGVGQLLLTDSADFVGDAIDKELVFERRGTSWVEYSRSYGALGLFGIASQTEAEAGTNNTKGMTPLRTFQSIVKLLPAQENFLANGDFRSAEEGTVFNSTTTPANNDDTYVFDVWKLLSDGNDVFDLAQNTTAADIAEGSFAGIDLDVETINLKGGIIQFIENKEVERLFKQGNGKCSLSFSASTSDATNQTLIRAAVLEWNSTADSIVTEVINVWNAEGTNPSLAANWFYANTPAALVALTTSVQRFKIENISLNTASTKNLAFFVWSEDKTNGLGDIITISAAKLNSGSVATDFESRSIQKDLDLIYRYYYQTVPDLYHGVLGSYQTTGNLITVQMEHPVRMRISPTVTIKGTWSLTNVGSHAISSTSEYALVMGANITATGAGNIFSNNSGYLTVDARL